MALEKRVQNRTMNDTHPIADISQVENSLFIPNLEESAFLEGNFRQVLVKYVDTLKKYKLCIPEYIFQPQLYMSYEKSDYAIIDLLDKSENRSEEMIDVLQYSHDKYIARSDADNDHDTPSRMKRVFGGDVLTSERTYLAQLALHNSMMEFSKLQCIIY